jgi:hypothetical protein
LTHSAISQFTAGVNRTLTTARLVLFIEASHNTVLRGALTRGRAATEAAVIPALAQVGAHDPAAAGAAIAACFEGLILHNVARHDDAAPSTEALERSTTIWSSFKG